MKRALYIIIIALVWCGTSTTTSAQSYIKLNGLYALGGVVNPQVEFCISPHSTFQTEIVYSPWQSFRGHPLHFGIFLNEYRYYIKEHNQGFYVAGSAAMKAFHMSKPTLQDHRIVFQNRYCKGWGVMFGVGIGYEHRFAERWLLDVYAGFGFSHCWYNGYSMDGEIDMYPHRPEDKQPPFPDPYNKSAQWIPTKVGLSIGVLINRPKQ
jgi:hypothetical protein